MRYHSDQNDVTVFFLVLEDSEPESVLDMGMMIRKNNIISRYTGDIVIPDKVIIDGLELTGEPVLPIHEAVYDDIIYGQEALGSRGGYELGVILTDDVSDMDMASLLHMAGCHNLLTYDSNKKRLEGLKCRELTQLKLESKEYLMYLGIQA